MITGAGGYLGSHLARALVERGAQVHAVLRPSTRLDLLAPVAGRIHLHLYTGGTEETVRTVEKIKPDIIFHLAALFAAEHQAGEIKQMLDSNIYFGTQLLEGAATAGVPCFIHAGTHWQHYRTPEYCPANLYAATKQAFQDVAAYYASAYGMRLVTLKLTDTYGPFDPRPKILSLLQRAAQRGERLDLSPGEQRLGLLYIDDAVTAFLQAAAYAQTMAPHGEKSFLAKPREIYSLKEIVGIFEEVWGVKLQVNFGARPYRKREVMEIRCPDENILASHATVGLYEGLQKILAAEGESTARVHRA